MEPVENELFNKQTNKQRHANIKAMIILHAHQSLDCIMDPQYISSNESLREPFSPTTGTHYHHQHQAKRYNMRFFSCCAVLAYVAIVSSVTHFEISIRWKFAAKHLPKNILVVCLFFRVQCTFRCSVLLCVKIVACISKKTMVF